jgi:hypothetical protein
MVTKQRRVRIVPDNFKDKCLFVLPETIRKICKDISINKPQLTGLKLTVTPPVAYIGTLDVMVGEDFRMGVKNGSFPTRSVSMEEEHDATFFARYATADNQLKNGYVLFPGEKRNTELQSNLGIFHCYEIDWFKVLEEIESEPFKLFTNFQQD